MQQGKVMAYASKRLKDPEKNYPIHDLGATFVVYEMLFHCGELCDRWYWRFEFPCWDDSNNYLFVK